MSRNRTVEDWEKERQFSAIIVKMSYVILFVLLVFFIYLHLGWKNSTYEKAGEYNIASMQTTKEENNFILGFEERRNETVYLFSIENPDGSIAPAELKSSKTILKYSSENKHPHVEKHLLKYDLPEFFDFPKFYEYKLFIPKGSVIKEINSNSLLE